MFTLSKIFWLVFAPGKIIVIVLTLGAVLLFTPWRRTGRALVVAITAVLVLLGIFPVGYAMLEGLENRFPANPPLPEKVAGVIVLGGTVNPGLTVDRGQPALTDGAERLTEFIRIGRLYPDAKLVFSGGSGSLSRIYLKETSVARDLINSIGFPPDRVVFEGDSRNTHENAVLTRDIMTPKAGETWVLVTSALHMPRAVGCFRAAGWPNIVPYPVDYRTDGKGRFNLRFEPFGGIARVSEALREWIGLAVYRLLGRTETLYPRP
ncbi:MAG: YdcF family protein [Alphaproteobacteria bacterium]|jgi:uncharacterized SAM-binding protein YcdF (DUF218 family)